MAASRRRDGWIASGTPSASWTIRSASMGRQASRVRTPLVGRRTGGRPRPQFPGHTTLQRPRVVADHRRPPSSMVRQRVGAVARNDDLAARVAQPQPRGAVLSTFEDSAHDILQMQRSPRRVRRAARCSPYLRRRRNVLSACQLAYAPTRRSATHCGRHGATPTRGMLRQFILAAESTDTQVVLLSQRVDPSAPPRVRDHEEWHHGGASPVPWSWWRCAPST